MGAGTYIERVRPDTRHADASAGGCRVARKPDRVGNVVPSVEFCRAREWTGQIICNYPIWSTIVALDRKSYRYTYT